MFKENTIVFENPDGSYQLGLQPHYKDKKLIKCFKCKEDMLCNFKDIMIKCYNCESLNKNIRNSIYGKK